MQDSLQAANVRVNEVSDELHQFKLSCASLKQQINDITLLLRKNVSKYYGFVYFLTAL